MEKYSVYIQIRMNSQERNWCSSSVEEGKIGRWNWYDKYTFRSFFQLKVFVYCHYLEDIKEFWRLNKMWHPGLDSGTLKNLTEKKENLSWVYS